MAVWVMNGTPLTLLQQRLCLTEAGYPDGFTTVLNYRDVVRGYLPDPNIVAQDIQAQLKENLNITVNIEVMESGAFLAASDAGQLQGLHLLGWGADYPDQTNFLGYHFGAGASKQFGDHWDDITSCPGQWRSIRWSMLTVNLSTLLPIMPSDSTYR